MSSSTRLPAVAVILGMLIATSAAASGGGLNMLAYLDYPHHDAPPELQADWYYEVYDRNFENGGISGWIELQALRARDGSAQESLDTPSGRWTDYLSARLFRDEVELGPAEFEIRFAGKPVEGGKQGQVGGSVVVTRDSPAKATFRLSGPEGAPLQAGLYRLWIMLDTRDLPPGPAVYRALVIDDAGNYRQGTPGRRGGLVFKVQNVGEGPQIMANYFAQRSALESGKGTGEMMKAAKQGDRELPSKGSIPYYRKAIEFALEGLKYAPRDGNLLFQVAYNHVMLNECAAALPYMHRLWAVDPNNPAASGAFYHNMAWLSCSTSETVLPDPH